jgi:flagellar basal body-associated protein FliL
MLIALGVVLVVVLYVVACMFFWCIFVTAKRADEENERHRR